MATAMSNFLWSTSRPNFSMVLTLFCHGVALHSSKPAFAASIAAFAWFLVPIWNFPTTIEVSMGLLCSNSPASDQIWSPPMYIGWRCPRFGVNRSSAESNFGSRVLSANSVV